MRYLNFTMIKNRLFGNNKKVPIVVPQVAIQENIPEKIALAAIFKNEAPYIREWLEYHKLIGIDKFFLYDNSSDDDYSSQIKDFIKDGVVEIIPWPHFVDGANTQTLSYAHAIAVTANRYRWLAIIDLDEFIYPCGNEKLSEVLDSLRQYPQILVYWYMFGPSGHVTKPECGVLEAYRLRQKMPFEGPEISNVGEYKRTFKCKPILQPHLAQDYVDPHYIGTTALPYIGFNEFGKALRDPIEGISGRRIRINHYFTKSQQEFEKKISSFRVARQNTLRTQSRIDSITHGFREENLVIDNGIYELSEKLGMHKCKASDV